jgi:hypothetical protein
MVRATAAVLSAVLFAAPAIAGQDAKSSELAKQLAQLLEQKKMDSFAAADVQNEGVFVAALYYPGTELLVVSAKHFNPPAMAEKVDKKQFQDAYAELNAGATAGTRLLVMDTFADGLVAKPGNGNAPDSVDGTSAMTFDGNWKKAKQSEEDYMKQFQAAEGAYAHALGVLLAKLKASGT